MLRYPVKLSKDTNDTILVDVLDIPEAHTFGEDREEALEVFGKSLVVSVEEAA